MGTTDNFATSFLHFSLGELQACPFPDVVLPPLPMSALSSSPFGLVIEVFDDSDKVGADVVLFHGCPQSCMPYPVEGVL